MYQIKIHKKPRSQKLTHTHTHTARTNSQRKETKIKSIIQHSTVRHQIHHQKKKRREKRKMHYSFTFQFNNWSRKIKLSKNNRRRKQIIEKERKKEKRHGRRGEKAQNRRRKTKIETDGADQTRREKERDVCFSKVHPICFSHSHSVHSLLLSYL